jgi:hypothetical protein
MCAGERLVRCPNWDHVEDPWPDDTTWPLLICVLSTFCVLQAGPARGGARGQEGSLVVPPLCLLMPASCVGTQAAVHDGAINLGG